MQDHSSSAPHFSFLQSEGMGECFVLLHGISSGAASWSKQLAADGAHHCLLAWDAPGYGGSSLLDTPTPNAKDYAQRLKQLITQRNIKRFTLVGHSLGALMASAYAAMYPEDVSRLVLASVAQGYGLADEQKKQQVYQLRPQMLARLGPKGLAKERGPALLGRPTAENLALVKQVMARLTQSGFEGASYLLAYDSIEHYLGGVSCPVQMLAGTLDTITPLDDMRLLQQRYPHIELSAIEQAGHLLYVDQPERFSSLVFKA